MYCWSVSPPTQRPCPGAKVTPSTVVGKFQQTLRKGAKNAENAASLGFVSSRDFYAKDTFVQKIHRGSWARVALFFIQLHTPLLPLYTKKKKKYNIIEERPDKPKEKVKEKRPRPIIDIYSDDEGDSEIEP